MRDFVLDPLQHDFHLPTGSKQQEDTQIVFDQFGNALNQFVRMRISLTRVGRHGGDTEDRS